MDETNFDRLTKAIAGSRTRREVLRAFAGGLAAAALGIGRSKEAGAANDACLPPLATCATGGQCCAGACTGGRCPAANITAGIGSSGCTSIVGASCRVATDCCDGVCLNGGCAACLAPGSTCATSDQCCAGSCAGGRCIQATSTACQTVGVACRTNSDCCSGACGSGVCVCQPDGTNCQGGNQCCSGSCTNGFCGSGVSLGVYNTALQYVIAFYPRWLTYRQSLLAPHNQLLGPQTVNAVYREVVAINDDTLYASSFTDVSVEPVVLTVPPTTVTYSLLILDVYGDIFRTNIPARTPGTYGLTAPGWNGTLPRGIIQVPMPYAFTQVIFRADKFSNGTDQSTAAEQFRESLRLTTLSQYLSDPTQGVTTILPVEDFAISYKLLADAAVAVDPIGFLSTLQTAMHASTTPQLTGDLLALSNQFDALFGNGSFSSPVIRDQFAQGTRDAHAQIVAKYLSSTGPTNWINFTNIGDWGSDYIDRSGIAEFLQYGNDHNTAAYFHAFQDVSGAALDGSVKHYVLTFPQGGTPPVSRFWSVTAYTPDTVELVANSVNKFVVANYTPGLVTGQDGSVSIFIGQTLPPGAPVANWLPVPNGPFNIMLRAYGPVGSTLRSQYLPPGITPQS